MDQYKDQDIKRLKKKRKWGWGGEMPLVHLLVSTSVMVLGRTDRLGYDKTNKVSK